MMNTKLRLVLSFTILLGFFSVNAQQSYWHVTTDDKGKIPSLNRELDPAKSRFYTLDSESLYSRLANMASKQGSGVLIYFPDEKGRLRPFMVKENPVFAPALAAKYPNIKSYIGQSTEHEGERIRFSWSHRGLQAMIVYTDENRTSFMQKTSRQGNKYVVYSGDSRNKEALGFVCYTEAAMAKEEAGLAQRLVDDGLLSRFRIAVSATGEYTVFHGGTVNDALAAINATITRVNEVMETDLGVSLELVANNEDVIYTDPDTDPYDGDLSAQVQNTLTTNIGEANYDVGHLFHRDSDSGFAGFIAAVCQDNQKGSGYSQAQNPQGEFFDIDYVSHELGHQFGANHTWSFGSEGTGVQAEPASGTTIMSYAGIVAGENVQSNANDYYHYNSILQITDYLATLSCAQEIATGNNPPVITNTGDFTIPRSTAFVLEADATDPDAGDVLTYTWEQIDDGVVTTATFGPDNFLGANFRSLPPSTSSERYFPKLSEVAQGNLTQTSPALDDAWETVSDIEREMNFAVVVRDNVAGGGQVVSDLVKLSVIASAGPFVVNSQATQETVTAGSSIAVSWDVANTNAAPVNAQLVDIFLSTDGGLSFPIELVSDTPNDGSADVLIPGVSTSQARIMVKASNNVFFAVNASDFTILESVVVLQFDSLEYEVCQPDDLIVPFTYETFSGFNELSTFSALNVPAGLGVSFNPTSATDDDTAVSITFSNTGSVSPGTYPITIRANSASVTKDVALDIIILNTTFSEVVLSSPSDSAIDVSLSGLLSWELEAAASSYDLEIATDVGFNTVVETSSGIFNSYLPTTLEAMTTYYWRVKPVNTCGEGNFSTPFSFTTIDINCSSFTAIDLPIPIPETGPQTITSSVQVVDDLPVTDVNVTLDISHTYVSDMVITLESPTGTVVTLISNSCGDLMDIDVVFDNEGSDFSCGSMPALSGVIKPLGSLASFNGESSSGEWTLTIEDQFDIDGGALNNFSLEICVEGSFRPDSDGDGVFDEDDLCPNTAPGAEVDIDGCEIFRFAQNNFAVSVESESCIGGNDGNISVVAQATLDYSIQITGPDTNVTASFTDNYTLDNISGGVYTVCINATDGTDVYEEHCFELTLDEPAPLSVISSLSADGSQLVLDLNGAELYNIELNGDLIQSSDSQVTLDLKGGTNSLKVSSTQNCQGSYEEEIITSTEVLVYPNPFIDFAFVNLGNLEGETLISVHGTDGRLLIRKNSAANEVETALDFGSLPSGLYFVRLENKQMTKTFKIIKR